MLLVFIFLLKCINPVVGITTQTFININLFVFKHLTEYLVLNVDMSVFMKISSLLDTLAFLAS